MDYDKEKVDEIVLALMWLVIHGDRHQTRAWKGFDWDTRDRLHEQGLISNQEQSHIRRAVGCSCKTVGIAL